MRSYEYNSANRLSKVTRGNIIEENVYNGLGQRIQKIVSGNETAETRYFYNDEGQLLGEYSADGKAIVEIVYLGKLPVLAVTPSEVFYIHADQVFAPRAVLDKNARIVWQWNPNLVPPLF